MAFQSHEIRSQCQKILKVAIFVFMSSWIVRVRVIRQLALTNIFNNRLSRDGISSKSFGIPGKISILIPVNSGLRPGSRKNPNSKPVLLKRNKTS